MQVKEEIKKIVLTKKRLAALHTAISIDKVLYEKYRRMHEDFNRRCKEWDRRKQVVRVIKKDKNVNLVLQIVKEIKTDEGIYLEVR